MPYYLLVVGYSRTCAARTRLFGLINMLNVALPAPPPIAASLLLIYPPPPPQLSLSPATTSVVSPMQLLTGAEQDGNVNSRVMTTLSLHRSTELGHC
jgi:hypothetical protein